MLDPVVTTIINNLLVNEKDLMVDSNKSIFRSYRSYQPLSFFAMLHYFSEPYREYMANIINGYWANYFKIYEEYSNNYFKLIT